MPRKRKDTEENRVINKICEAILKKEGYLPIKTALVNETRKKLRLKK